MRKLFAATAAVAAVLTSSIGANAADLPVRPAPMPAPVYAPPPFSWAGFYVGGNIGGAWSHSTITDNLTGASLSTGTVSGFIGGGQLGYNFQTGAISFSAQNGSLTALRSNGPRALLPLDLEHCRLRLSTPWVSSLAARFGYAFDRSLIYGKVGGGWVDNKLTVTNLTTGLSGVQPIPTAVCFWELVGNTRSTRIGRSRLNMTISAWAPGRSRARLLVTGSAPAVSSICSRVASTTNSRPSACDGGCGHTSENSS